MPWKHKNTAHNTQNHYQCPHRICVCTVNGLTPYSLSTTLHNILLSVHIIKPTKFHHQIMQLLSYKGCKRINSKCSCYLQMYLCCFRKIGTVSNGNKHSFVTHIHVVHYPFQVFPPNSESLAQLGGCGFGDRKKWLS